jgi:hypothetical protein
LCRQVALTDAGLLTSFPEYLAEGFHHGIVIQPQSEWSSPPKRMTNRSGVLIKNTIA